MSGEIPRGVRRFIHRTINSIEQLEVLLFLMSNSDRAWTAGEVSERTRLAVESVYEKLRGLSTAKLLQIEDSSIPTYRYAPTSDALAKEVAEQLNVAYQERKDTIVQLIYSRPLDNIKIFADAFRIGKEEE